MTRRIASVVCCVVCMALACDKRPVRATTTEGSGASGPGTSASKAASLPEPVPFDDVLISEGKLDNRGFTLEFRIRRNAGDAGKSYDAAAAACRASGRMLCTELQWLRACEAHPVIGKMQSWTASRRGRLAVVRGGKDCGRRDKVDGGNTHAHRVGLCCERAVALRASGDAGPWLGPAGRLPVELEKAYESGDEAALRYLFADQVMREGREWKVDALLEREAAARSEIRWMIFDKCDLRSGPVVVDKQGPRTGRRQGMILNCRTVLSRSNDVLDYYTRLGFVTDEDGERYRLAQIEHKSDGLIPGGR